MQQPQLPAVEIKTWAGQNRLINDRTKFEHGVVSGVGYGKTTFGARWHHMRCQWNKESRLSVVVAPKYELAKTVNLEYYRDFLTSIGYIEDIHFTINKADLTLEYFFGHKVLFRSAEAFRKIVAYNISHFWVDEAGLCPPEVRRELVKRCRDPKATVRQGLYTGTPEGINWYSELFTPTELERDNMFSIGDNKLVLHGRSFDNTDLPLEFFDNLRDAFGWNENLWRAYVLGEFVPLFENSCYDFDAAINTGHYPPNPKNKTLYLTWDFNVGQVSWGALQQEGALHYLVAENKRSCRDTDQGCDHFLQTFPSKVWNNNETGDTELIITGDSSGYNRDTRNRVDNDYAIIKERLSPHYPMLRIRAPQFNPPVAASIIATNRLFVKKLLFFDKSCVKHIHSAQATAYDGKGGIAKPAGETVTHPMDDVRYYVNLVAPARDRTHLGQGVSF